MNAENPQVFNRLEKTGMTIGSIGFYTSIISLGYEIATHFHDPEKMQLTLLTSGGVAATVIGSAIMWTGFAKDVLATRKQNRKIPTFDV